MADEIILADFVTEGNAIAGMMGPAWVAKTFGVNVVRTETFPDNTNVLKVPISGSLSAEILAELATPTANAELIDTSVSCTAEKSVVRSYVSVESLRFGGPTASLQRIADEHAAGHGRLFDTKLKALFTGLSQGVTASAGLTKDNLLDARYYVTSRTDGNISGLLVGAFDYKGVSEVRKELTSITATAFSNMDLLSLVGLKVPGVSPVGEFAGIQIYETSGLPTSGGDDVAAVWDPMHCFFAGVDLAFNVTIIQPSGSNGLTHEVTSWMYFKNVEWRDEAGCKVLSDT